MRQIFQIAIAPQKLELVNLTMATRPRHVDMNGEQYQKGDRVRIQSGSYVDHLYGTFVDYCGYHKVFVKVDNDSAVHRRLLKKSIRHVTERDKKLHGPLVNGGPARKPKKDVPVKDIYEVDDTDVNSLLNDLSSLKKAIADIELKVKAYKKNNKRK